MKKYSLNIVALLVITLGCFINCLAGTATLSWQRSGSSSAYGSGAISTCGVANSINFKVDYSTSAPGGTIPPNPYKYEILLYRNGALLANQTYQSLSSTWVSHVFYNVAAAPGNYSAVVKFYKHNIFGWPLVDSQNTAQINSSAVAANPDFYISTSVGGPPVLSVGGIITLNIWQPIILNAENSTCESFYNVDVQENDQWWNRPGKYEWGKWFTGEAPNNLNLQQLAATYSVPPNMLGSSPDPARYGTPLIGGNLAGSSLLRYYRVSICTNEPTWRCKTELLRINN